MILAWRALFTLVLLFVVATNANLDYDEDEIYSNSWAIEVEGGIEAAQKIAAKHGFIHVGKLDHLPVHHFVHPSSPSQSTQRHHSKHADLLKEDGVVHVEQQRVRRRVKRSSYSPPVDPEWFNQWYLHRPAHDMDVKSVWQQGITGKGIVVSILDDGLEHTHPDLKNNYDPLASYDFNSHDSDPIPRYDYSNENKHGTRCAGEVAAAKNNICSVGVAYGAQIGGVRMLDGTVTDIVEASSLSFNSQYIDIYSSSWGPNDDGVTIDGPARLAKHAFVHGVTEGRGGKGSIYVWASGNGGTKDNCNCDGYAVSPYTISVGSASEHDDFPWYAEFCSSTLAVTYSSGSSGERQIVSTDLRHGCTQRHTGTSASAPMAAGLLALALEVNSNLTWRDAQYLIVYSSNPDIPKGDDWFINGAGLHVSHRYGYGMMDAAAIVNRARHWINVPARQTCNISVAISPSLQTATNSRQVQVDVTIDDSTCKSIKYLEHVQVVSTINIATGRRGDISLSVRSPHGTLSHLLKTRYLDRARKNIEEWPFMTIQSWGENPMGKWVITLKARGMTAASLKQATLVLYGVSEVPASVSNIPSKCHDECAKNCARSGSKYCDSCKQVRLASTLECVPVCPPGTYKDYSMCRPCSTNCSSCTHTACLSCQPGSILLPDGTCSYSCPISSYNTANKTCAPCHPSCLSCSGPNSTDCTVCASQYKLTKGMCKLNTSCDSHSYYDHRAFECRQCHPSCAECRGREAVDCLSCYAGRIHVNGHCVQDPVTKMSCHSGQYYNEASSNCSMCPTGCGNCSDDITCTQCLAGYFLQPRAVGDTSEETVLCHSSCTSGYYADASTHHCMPCPSSCVSCSDPSSCVSCVEGTPVDGRCAKPCAAMEYYNITSRTCLSCSPSCAACRDGATCTSCSGQLFLTGDGQCISTCPNHTVMDQISRRCESIQCHPSCSTCRGIEPSDCLSCSYPRKFHQNTCLEQCPMDTYPAKHSCKPCHSSCATCGGPLESDCDSCPHNTYFNHYHCLESCPRGSFPTEGRCLACIADCEECGDVRSCKRCSSGQVYSPDEMLCKSSCPSGLFNSNGVCQQCHASCATCQSSASHCTSCSSGHAALQSDQSACLGCCSKEVSSSCCNCSSSTDQCVYVGNPISFYTHTPSSLPGSSGVTSPSFIHSQSVVVVLIVTVIVILVTVVIVIAVLVYRRRHATLPVTRPYRPMEQAHDGLSIAVIEDDEFDTESESEIFINHKP